MYANALNNGWMFTVIMVIFTMGMVLYTWVREYLDNTPLDEGENKDMYDAYMQQALDTVMRARTLRDDTPVGYTHITWDDNTMRTLAAVDTYITYAVGVGEV